MDIALQPAYILHRRNYRENSLLLDVFMLEAGRVACIARGALNSRHGRSALLQPFQPLQLSCSGKGTLLTVKDLEAASAAIPLQGKALFCAYYINELVLYLLPERESLAPVFAYYVHALTGLQEGALEFTLRRFEIQLLTEMGLAPDFLRDDQGRDITAEHAYLHSTDGQFVLADKNSVTYSDTQFTGETLQFLAQTDDARYRRAFDDQPVLRREAKNLMRRLLDQALHGRRLNSRTFFEKAMPSAKHVNKKENDDG